MRKISFVSALLVSIAVAIATVRADITNGVAFYAISTFTFLQTPGSVVGAGALYLNPANDSNRLFRFNATADDDLRFTFGDAGVTPSQQFLLASSTPDGDDDSFAYVLGGGAVGSQGSRGAGLKVEGNEVSGGGDLLLFSGNASGSQIEIKPQNDTQRQFTFDATSDTAHTLTYGDSGVTSLQTFTISASTSDSDDDGETILCGGGAFGSSRGGCIDLYGNENGGAPGYAYFQSGNVSGASVQLTVNSSDGTIIHRLNGSNRWIMDTAGTFIGNGTGSIGWSVQSAANQACNTTCVTPCVFGQNAGASNVIVGCTDATADVCVCAGAT